MKRIDRSGEFVSNLEGLRVQYMIKRNFIKLVEQKRKSLYLASLRRLQKQLRRTAPIPPAPMGILLKGHDADRSTRENGAAVRPAR
jgi:hypothetical protein